MNKRINTIFLILFVILLACIAVVYMPDYMSINLSWDDPVVAKYMKDGGDSSNITLKDYLPDAEQISFARIPLKDLFSSKKIGKILLCAIVLGLFSLCFSHICPEIRRRRYFGAMGSIIVITLLVIGVDARLLSNYPSDLQYLCILFLSLPALVVTPLFGFRPAVCIGLLTSFLVDILLDISFFNSLLFGVFLTCASGFFVHHCKVATYRKYIVYNGGSLWLANFILLICFSIIFKDSWTSMNLDSIIGFLKISFCGSFFSVIFAVVLLSVFEWIFRIETNMTFIDLTNKDHYLLKELRNKANGTWEHCNDVADVAEQAALAIGANHLKVRACALYHDVGKTNTPEMFTENAKDSDGWTKLNDLSPKEAVEIIRNHVEYGRNLIHYPHKSIKEAIASHHGTMPIGAFYQKALAQYNEQHKEGEEPPKEADFRYAGPLPANREEVILMMADSICAAVQSIKEKNTESIENMVSAVFVKQLEKRQYDQSNITVHDLLTAYTSILESLLIKNKCRIDYRKAAASNTKKQ